MSGLTGEPAAAEQIVAHLPTRDLGAPVLQVVPLPPAVADPLAVPVLLDTTG